jgi:hypothetical protein
MAFHGIRECFHHEQNRWFTGVTCTNGAGSPRTGRLRPHYTDEEMKAVRRQEQNQAAFIGRYSAMIQLDHPSADMKNATDTDAGATTWSPSSTPPGPRWSTPTTSPTSTTPTSRVVIPLIQAIRRMPRDQRPAKVYGCEVWRALDWMDDAQKVALDVSGYDNLARAKRRVRLPDRRRQALRSRRHRAAAAPTPPSSPRTARTSPTRSPTPWTSPPPRWTTPWTSLNSPSATSTDSATTCRQGAKLSARLGR